MLGVLDLVAVYGNNPYVFKFGHIRKKVDPGLAHGFAKPFRKPMGKRPYGLFAPGGAEGVKEGAAADLEVQVALKPFPPRL